MIFDNISKKMQWRKCSLCGKKKKKVTGTTGLSCQKNKTKNNNNKKNQMQTSQKLKPMDHRPECKMQNYKSPRR